MATKKQATTTGRYFIVNPAGAIHEVSREHAQERLGQKGYRMATKEEVARLMAQGENQTFDAPLCEPFTTMPVAIEVEEVAL